MFLLFPHFFLYLSLTGAPTGPRIARAASRRGSKKQKNPQLAGAFLMRLNGVEPSRVFPPTRPSTLRVYQFRHSRLREGDSRCLRAGGGRTLRSSGGAGTLRTS